MTTPNTLADIRTKVRNLTGRPSDAQMTNAAIDRYVNTYYLQDMPESLRLLKLEDVYTFTTTPNVDVYAFPSNAYTTVKPPVYVAGQQMQWFADNDIFYRQWPKLSYITQVATGNGTVGPYSGVIAQRPFLTSVNTLPVLNGKTETYGARGAGNTIFAVSLFSTPTYPGSIVVTDGTTVFTDDGLGGFIITGGTGTVNAVTDYVTGSINITFTTASPGATLTADYSQIIRSNNAGKVQNILFTANDVALGSIDASDDGFGNILVPGSGTVNDVTGAFTVNFPAAITAGVPIYAEIVPYVASRPRSILFFQNQFTLRPVPDKAYVVEINTQRVPTELINATDTPEIDQLWQLLAFGAAQKILVDNGDFEVAEKMRPYFEQQMILAQRKTIRANAAQRASTIFDGTSGNAYSNLYPYI